LNGRVCYVFLLLFGFCAFTSCCRRSAEPLYFSGRTMGTVYHITAIPETTLDDGQLIREIQETLESVNKGMSMFDRNSELSRFNALSKNETMCVSAPFMDVFRVGSDLYRITGGAWDGTVGPLVNLWGFGSSGKGHGTPDTAAIEKARSNVGFHQIRVSDGHCLSKMKNGLVLDFGSIAKGYAVDEIANLLKRQGVQNYLVEIGGEIRAGGTNRGRPWKVGISLPVPGVATDRILGSLELRDRAIATSGDYRNFRVIGGKTYSHEIDPRTGWPVRNKVASVTVIGDTAVFADGLATALMVMGEDKGIDLVNRLPGVSCLFVIREEGGAQNDSGFRTMMSRGFPPLER